MKTTLIINKFEKKGYDVTKSISTGQIIVKAPWGAVSTFSSYSAAYKFYF